MAEFTRLHLEPSQLKSAYESQIPAPISYLHYAFITSLAMNVFLLSGATSFVLLCLAR